MGEFRQRLRKETALLKEWFQSNHLDQPRRTIGLELEAWLVDEHFAPAARNAELLQNLNDPLFVPELSQFNIELNAEPQMVGPGCLEAVSRGLQASWEKAARRCEQMGLHLLMVGSLPTLSARQLNMSTISDCDRYRMLNARISALRGGPQARLKIDAADVGQSHLSPRLQRGLNILMTDIVMEAAATSLQIHVQVSAAESAAHYNASALLSPIMAGACANAPFLFGKRLWAESRIPLFEQALRTPGFANVEGDYIERVTLGSGYVRRSVFELFLENLDCYPVLLPHVHDRALIEQLRHLRLHNGTIWRWNRPVLGVPDSDHLGPHLRLEHRIPSAGPSVRDVVAHVAFFVGALRGLAALYATEPDRWPVFALLRQNLYTAAREGLEAQMVWKGDLRSVREICLGDLIPMARRAWIQDGMPPDEIDHHLEPFVRRVEMGRTGASWQRAVYERCGRDLTSLVERYWECQMGGQPIHQWEI